MANLWYTNDEVRDFHPHVENCLVNGLKEVGKLTQFEVVHHPTIPGFGTIPDFGIRSRISGNFILIVEVKRTLRDVNSDRYADQARSYVTNFIHHWETGFHPYFILTNIERSVFFCERTGTTNGCILEGSPIDHGEFDRTTHNADLAIQNFENELIGFLKILFAQTSPVWNNEWSVIIQSLISEHNSVKGRLTYSDSENRELSLYEFFRLLTYAYLDRFYQLKNSKNQSYFRQLPIDSNPTNFKADLSHNFSSILSLDFKQVFENHPDPGLRLFPDNFSASIHENFLSVIRSLRGSMPAAVRSNPSPTYFFNLLTSKVYDKDELHSEGKIMSDDELAQMLSFLLIDDYDCQILDPCSGDCALLDASYDRLKFLENEKGITPVHNDILEKLHGIEIDPFLSQMGTFRLISKNLLDVNPSTEVDIRSEDMFKISERGRYDVVLMNPPFLRNEDLPSNRKNLMKNAITAVDSLFFQGARQANLYYYFVNYCWHFLNEQGKAGIILMEKFLNNQDGEYLKTWLLDKAEAIIAYPDDYFSEFKVTSVIVILNKALPLNSGLKILNIRDSELIENPLEIKNILIQDTEISNAQANLRILDRVTLNPSDNWTLFLQTEDNVNLFLNQINGSVFMPVGSVFNKVTRGNAEAQGGSNIVFLKDNDPLHQEVEPRFRGYGLKNSRAQRRYELSSADMLLDEAVHFPSRYDDNCANGLPSEFLGNSGLNNFYSKNASGSWKKIVNAAFNNTIRPNILIPRAGRTKHAVYYYPHQMDVVVSTNFAYLSGFNLPSDSDFIEEQIKFCAAFLLSSFGQLQIELQSNDQEGMRKLEVFQIERIRIPNTSLLTPNEIINVNLEFDKLSNSALDFVGTEGLNGPRRALDQRIAEVLFSRDSLGFDNVTTYTDYFENMLFDIVRERRN